MRKDLRFNLFEEDFYELTHMKALSMVKNVFELVFASFFQLSYLKKFKRYIY